MRKLLIAAFALSVGLSASLGVAYGQPAPPVGPMNPFTNDTFIDSLAGNLGISSDSARSAMQQTLEQLPAPVVSSSGVQARTGSATSLNPPAVGTVTSVVTGSGAGPGGLVRMGVSDDLVNGLAGALNLPTDAVRSALEQTLQQVQPLPPPAVPAG